MQLNDHVRAAITAGRHAHLATINPDGSPQMSMVWVGLDGDEIVFAHLGAGRKVSNILRDPRVALTIEAEGTSGPSLHNYLVVRGTATVTVGGAPELLQRLAAVYLGEGVRFPPMDDPPPGNVVSIRVERIGGLGPWT
jgi:PPOX class probable F420-dependent enzyme